MSDRRPGPFNLMSAPTEAKVSRAGKKVVVTTLDGSFTDSDSCEANLLFEILKELRKKK